ncbi:MAG TPA: hypothetical protein VHG10_06100 [Glycomyces sp.]|nr:hypothetical protein [Glycomyces sp.]
MKAALAPLYAVLAPLAGEDQDPETLTETGWASIHGLAALGRDDRLRPGFQAARLRILVRKLTGA